MDDGTRTETDLGTFDGRRATPDPEAQQWPKETGRILRRDEVWALYCAMDGGRSLVRLHAELAAKYTPWQRPALDTMRRWARVHNWYKRVQDFDRSVQREAMGINQTLRAEDQADLSMEARATGFDLLQKIQREIGQVPIENGSQLKAVATAAVALFQYANVQDGGVSDRQALIRDGEDVPDATEALKAVTIEVLQVLRAAKRDVTKPLAGVIIDQ